MLNGRLDELIRNNSIDSEMATSLANDSDNVAGISKNLIRVAELLYIRSDTILGGVSEYTNEEIEAFRRASDEEAYEESAEE